VGGEKTLREELEAFSDEKLLSMMECISWEVLNSIQEETNVCSACRVLRLKHGFGLDVAARIAFAFFILKERGF